VHRKSREVAKAIRDLEAELGREARDAEIATRMGIDLAHYHRIIQDTVACQMTNIDDTATGEINDHRNDPFADIVDENFRTELTQAIGELPEREKLVMSLYYGDDLNLKEIGAVLKVTESRVCQLHGQALARLKARLSSWRDQGSAA
jgi:RNA polymerase sigma factor for flagellar operon FliA